MKNNILKLHLLDSQIQIGEVIRIIVRALKFLCSITKWTLNLTQPHKTGSWDKPIKHSLG